MSVVESGALELNRMMERKVNLCGDDDRWRGC
jgi:hypothetical protein